VIAACEGKGDAVESPIGLLPAKGAIDTSDLGLNGSTMESLLSVSKEDWRKESEGIGEFFDKFGDHLPEEMSRQRELLEQRLG
jgi:phosphoenolpyruvate carboxykinase (GTP)